MIFVTKLEEFKREWIPMEKIYLVEEEIKGYQKDRVSVYVEGLDDPIELDDAEEIKLFMDALHQFHNNQIAGPQPPSS